MRSYHFQQAIIQREFLHAYLEALTKAGIRVPTIQLICQQIKKNKNNEDARILIIFILVFQSDTDDPAHEPYS